MVCDKPRDNWLVFTAGCMGAGERERWNRGKGVEVEMGAGGRDKRKGF